MVEHSFIEQAGLDWETTQAAMAAGDLVRASGFNLKLVAPRQVATLPELGRDWGMGLSTLVEVVAVGGPR